ncbi:MAG TPA: glucose-1-phosphate cytidylyltransferase [Rhodospirillaceae bacterium]|nr:MAG: glucose-1-phosphate cytidylyltransferase [Alphaproteobacteria bacterium GWF2_58_20]HAU28745.1 glucose-1-phosphate cytidylyltransferase [Rhodospirillaceae bacterium]
MKAVILAGGFGTRISEESQFKPKPMIEIGGKPILWHIMKTYSHYGINDFIICLGWKGYVIKEYFSNYFMHMSDITIDLEHNRVEVHHKKAEPWRITLVDTGETSQTGGRLRRVRDYIGDETFCFTYGDGVSDVAIDKLIAHHKQAGLKATITAIQPPGRYGVINIADNNQVEKFHEKPMVEGAWINGGFFVLEPSVLDYIEKDETSWELDPMHKLVAEGQVSAYCHSGFWQAMDTLREKNYLENLWQKGEAPWKVWS